LQKLSQPNRKNRRLYPRVKGRLTTEISQDQQDAGMMGMVTNLSLGGCYVETSAILLPGSQTKLTFIYGHAAVTLRCEVVRMDMGTGAALKFVEMNHESRAAIQRMLEQLASTAPATDRTLSRNAAAGPTS